MNLKQEVIDSLKRETNICRIAITHLKQECRLFERKYKMSTEGFIIKFNKGLLDDKQDFFKWHAIAEGVKDWKKRQKALKEIVR